MPPATTVSLRVAQSIARYKPFVADFGRPIDLLCYARDSLEVTMKRRFKEDDAYFEMLTVQWISGSRKIFRELPTLAW